MDGICLEKLLVENNLILSYDNKTLTPKSFIQTIYNNQNTYTEDARISHPSSYLCACVSMHGHLYIHLNLYVCSSTYADPLVIIVRFSFDPGRFTSEHLCFVIVSFVQKAAAGCAGFVLIYHVIFLMIGAFLHPFINFS